MAEGEDVKPGLVVRHVHNPRARRGKLSHAILNQRRRRERIPGTARPLAHHAIVEVALIVVNEKDGGVGEQHEERAWERERPRHAPQQAAAHALAVALQVKDPTRKAKRGGNERQRRVRQRDDAQRHARRV